MKFNYKKPMRGMYTFYLRAGEKLQVYKGRARRIPKDNENLFNAVPLKFLTSVEVVEEKEEIGNDSCVNEEKQMS